MTLSDKRKPNHQLLIFGKVKNRYLSQQKQNDINVFLGLFQGTIHNLRVKTVLPEIFSFEGIY